MKTIKQRTHRQIVEETMKKYEVARNDDLALHCLTAVTRGVLKYGEAMQAYTAFKKIPKSAPITARTRAIIQNRDGLLLATDPEVKKKRGQFQEEMTKARGDIDRI